MTICHLRRWFALAIGFAAWVASADAKLVSRTVNYEHAGEKLAGYLAYDDATGAKRPGVLIVHEWWGCNEFARSKADTLAGLGYVAFALDMYGTGKVTPERKQAAEWSGRFYGDAALLRARAQAGLDVLLREPLVRRDRVAAIGFCFGGSVVLNFALGGADLRGVVSFHGGLSAVPVDADKPVRAKLLILHGADDPLVEARGITEFQACCRKAKADWQMVYYGGAVHSFTNPKAGSVGIPGVAYDRSADERSWRAMRDFFAECLGDAK